MYRKTYQAGFIIPLIIIILGIVLAVGVGTVVYQNRATNQPATQNAQDASSSANPQQSATPSLKPAKPPAQATGKTPIPTPKPTIKPTSSPTPAPVTNSAPSNPYDLTSATGSVKVMVKAQSGNLAYIPQAELSTVSGFKVLDGKSTDKITQFGKDRTDELRGEIVFSTAPPGPYKVRIFYNGSWSDQKDVSVSSAKQSYVEFSVAGVAPTPTPTPKPKPICSVSVLPSSNGTAPYEASVCVGNNSNPYQAVQKEFVDYDGNGSWDYEGAQYGCHSYAFQTPGSYSPKAKIIGASGDESDVCQTTVTIN